MSGMFLESTTDAFGVSFSKTLFRAVRTYVFSK